MRTFPRVAVVIAVVACTPAPVAPSPSAIVTPTPTATAATSAAPRTSSPTQPPPSLPIVIAMDPRAGVVFGGGFRYEGASGRIEPSLPGQISADGHDVRLYEQRNIFRVTADGTSEIDGPAAVPYVNTGDISTDGSSAAFVYNRQLYVAYRGDAPRLVPDVAGWGVLWSPDGRHLAVTECLVCGAILGETRLDIYDSETRSLVDFYESPIEQWYGDRLMAICGRGVGELAWSPDGRYLAGLERSACGRAEVIDAQLKQSGQLLVFDVATARTWSLGRVLFSRFAGTPSPWFAWGADHTLAFVNGDDGGTWSNKTLQLWTPELGLRAVARGALYSLSWEGTGSTLYAVTTTGADVTPNRLLAGDTPSDGRVIRVDARTLNFTSVFGVPRLRAARVSGDGKTLLYVGANAMGVVGSDGRDPRTILDGLGFIAFKPTLNWTAWDR